MSNKGVRVNVDLDFTSGHIDREGINKQINSAIDAVKINLDPQSAKEFEAELKQLGGMLQKHLNEATGKINAKGLVAEIDNSENLDMVEKLGARFASVGVDARQSFSQIADETDFLNKKLVTSSGTLDRMGETLQNTIRWNISSSIVNAVTGEFQQMYYFAKDLDRTLNDIRIVTGKSKEEMEAFGVAANNAARNLKVSTIEYGDAATLFFQQGFDEKQVENMTEAAVIASKITGAAAIDMSDLLTSTLNGFTMTTDQILDVVDKFAGVGAETASDFEELSIGMSKVASIGNTAGVSIDQLTGQLATIISVTREAPETVGTALKTIYGRMLNFKEDKDALIEDDDGKVFGVPDVEQAIADYNRATGAQVKMFETTANGNKVMRDLGDVIEEIGEAWGNTEDKTVKFALTTALAGSRQQNHIIALMDNWDMYKDAVQTSLTSEGTALKQNEIYMDSYEAKLKGMQAEKERLFMSLTDTDGLKNLIDMLTSTLSLFTDIVEKVDLVGLGVGVVGAVFSDQIIDKLTEARGLAVSVASMSKQALSTQTNSDEEVRIMQDLATINKRYGDEKANQVKNEIRGLRQVQKEHSINKDLMESEVTLLKTMKSHMDAYGDSAKGIGAADREIEEAKARRENIETAKELREHYVQLQEAQERLSELKEQASYLGEGDALSDVIAEAEADVDSIEARIDSVHRMSEEARDKALSAHELAEDDLRSATDALNEQAEAARKAEQASRFFRGAALMLPAVISSAKMETHELSDKMSNLGKMAIPAVISGIASLIPAMITATAGATTMGAAITAAIPVAGPFLAAAGLVLGLGGAFVALTHEVDETAQAMEKLDENLEGLAESEGDVKKTEDAVKRIKDRIEEIARIRKETTDGHVLAELDREEESLKRQLKISERDLQIEQEKLKVKQQAAAEEFAEELEKEVEVPDYLDPSFDEYLSTETIKRAELAKRYTKELEKNEKAIEDILEKLQEMNVTQKEAEEVFKSGGESLNEYEGRVKDLLFTYGQTRQTIEDIKENGGDLYDKLAPSLTELENVEGFEEMFGKVREEVDELVDSVYDLDNAPEVQIGGQISEDDAKNAGDYADALDELAAIYYDVANSQHEAGSSSERLWKEYETLYDAELELNREGKISSQTYLDLMDLSDDFVGAIDLEQDALHDLITGHRQKTDSVIDDAIDQRRAVIDSIKDQINAYAELVGAMWDARKAQSESAELYDAPKFRPHPFSADTYAKNKGKDSEKEAEEIRGRRDAIKETAIERSNRAAKKKKEKEEKFAEADRYEKLNLLLTKNNSLMSLNSTFRDRMTEGTTEYNKTLDREIELQKERQSLLHQRAEEMRKEGRELEKSLSGVFEFEGDWDDNSRIITNMGAIQGKSKEMEEDFKRVLEIMKTLPEGSEDWRKIQTAIEDIEIEKFRIELEEVTKTMSDLDDAIFELEYAFQMGDIDDFTRKADRLTGEIELQDNAIKETTARLNAFKRETEASGRVSAELAKEIEKTEKQLKEEEIALRQTTRARKELIRAEKERLKQQELDRRQSEVDSVEAVQDIIVEIIRKRGEEEQRILDANHKKELDRLNAEREARQKQYDADLDAYRKLINDKIAALDAQYAEEDYREALAKEQEEAARLQSEIDVLSLDDSLTANNKKAELREQLAKQLEKIEKMERKRSRDETKKALQDELKDYESQQKDKQDAEEESYNTTIQRLEDEYERKKRALEEEYSNANVYAEARESLIRGTVEVSKGAFEDISIAHKKFQEDFGAGMGALGDIIQAEFLDKMAEVESAYDRMNSGGFMQRPPQSIDDIDDSELPGLGYEKPRDPNTSEKVDNRPSEFLDWSKRDYDNYIENKQQWERTDHKGAREIYESKNKALRTKYWGKDRAMEDNYHWSELLDIRGFKDGGILDETGLFLGHGNEQSSEVVFSAKTAKKLWEYVETMPKLKDMKAPSPDTNNMVNLAGNDYNIAFDVQGNLDRSLLPEIEDMIKGAIDESEFEKIKRLKKAGQFRSI